MPGPVLRVFLLETLGLALKILLTYMVSNQLLENKAIRRRKEETFDRQKTSFASFVRKDSGWES